MKERLNLFENIRDNLIRAEKNDNYVALLSIKLSRFNDICIVHNYNIADKLLNEIHTKIKTALRSSDYIARISENSFIAILPEIRNQGHATMAAAKISAIFSNPIMIDDKEIFVNLFIGISIAKDNSITEDTLMKNADMAMSAAKTSQDGYAVFEGSTSNTSTSLIIENEVKQALEEDKLELFFQPKVDLKTGKIKGAESLTRWLNSNSEHSRPDIFIPVVEETDLIIPFTAWTINTALRNCRQFIELVDDFSVAVNLSTNLLYDFNIITQVTDAIELWNIPPHLLTLEVTEGAMMVNPKKSIATLNKLRECGFRLSMDDFGTGYSSMSYLKDLPIHELKIDKSFVMNMLDNKGDEGIVRSIINLSHNFGLSVVAEGVESGPMLDLLTELGCDYGQGFYIGKPMPKDSLLEWIIERQ